MAKVKPFDSTLLPARVVMSEALTGRLFDTGYELAAKLYATVAAESFNEAQMKAQLVMLYAFVSKYKTLWSARDPSNKTYQLLVALDLALQQLATVGKGYAGTRVALAIVEHGAHLKGLAVAIRGTSLPGVTARMTADDRNMFTACLVELQAAILAAMDDTTTGIVKYWRNVYKARKTNKDVLKEQVRTVFGETEALMALADAADSTVHEVDDGDTDAPADSAVPQLPPTSAAKTKKRKA